MFSLLLARWSLWTNGSVAVRRHDVWRRAKWGRDRLIRKLIRHRHSYRKHVKSMKINFACFRNESILSGFLKSLKNPSVFCISMPPYFAYNLYSMLVYKNMMDFLSLIMNQQSEIQKNTFIAHVIIHKNEYMYKGATQTQIITHKLSCKMFRFKGQICNITKLQRASENLVITIVMGTILVVLHQNQKVVNLTTWSSLAAA